MIKTHSPPAVLILAGLDPSGGAGLAADIQAVTAAGAHPMPVTTLITAQSLRRVARVEPLDPALVAEQVHVALEDIAPSAVKLGALGNAAIAATIAELLAGPLADVPVVLDPVLVATSGDALGEDGLAAVMRDALLPRAALVTPNEDELNALSDAGTPQERTARLVEHGAGHVLATGLAGVDADELQDVLVGPEGLIDRLTSRRLPGEFHGSGCSLASYCAAHLALGRTVHDAVVAAHADAAEALAGALDFGYDVRVPARRG
ncbi:MAG: hydroxymethylpyrimidine/phosphomethylpyrimidine kinase [Pseudomonadota bacterium]